MTALGCADSRGPMPDPTSPVVANPPWAELVQLIPVIALAFPVVTSGRVDLPSMTQAFPAAGGLAIAVTLGVLAAGKRLNPILVGTDLWLLLGAIGFGLGVSPIADLWAAWQGFALFALVVPTLGVAMATPPGAIGADGPRDWVRSRSIAVLSLSILALGWAWAFRHDVRLGGGLPFVVVNVTRRALVAHGVRATGTS